jgi:YHS domain-containing protein
LTEEHPQSIPDASKRRSTMTSTWKKLLAGAAGVLALALTISLAADRPAEAPAQQGAASEAPAAEAPQAALAVVASHEVCMVNDTFFGRDQIPVEVGGQTYYGCCEGCKQRLAEDEAIRYATDPATGERVDKATATIAARPDGSVLYFASEENLAKYRDGGGA